SAGKQTDAVKVGAKVGLASSTANGILTSCCTTVIPRVLNGTGSLGTAFTTTYSTGVSGWPFTDPDSGVAFRLECVNPGTGFIFRCFNAQAGCTKTYTQLSKTCGHPFSVSTRTQLGGGGCVIAGTYDFSFSG